MLVNIAIIRAYDMARVSEVLSALELHFRDHMTGYSICSMTRKCKTFVNIHIFHISLVFLNYYFK